MPFGTNGLLPPMPRPSNTRHGRSSGTTDTALWTFESGAAFGDPRVESHAQAQPEEGPRSTVLKTVLNNEIANIIAHDTAGKRDQRQERPLEAAGEGPLSDGKGEQSAVDRQRDIAYLVSRLPADLRPTARLLMAMSPAEAARQPGMTREKVAQQAKKIARYFREFGWKTE